MEGKASHLVFSTWCPSFSTMDAQSTEKILPGALDDTLTYLVPFRAHEGWARPHSCPSSSVCSNQGGQGILCWCPSSIRAAADTHRHSRHLSEQKRDFFILLRPSKPLPHCFAILEPGVQCVASFHSGPHLPEEARN